MSSSTLPVYNMAVFNGRQFINAYSVMSSGGLADRRPTQWTLSASNDQETWVVLDKKDHMHFTDMYQTKTFTLPTTPRLHLLQVQLRGFRGHQSRSGSH